MPAVRDRSLPQLINPAQFPFRIHFHRKPPCLIVVPLLPVMSAKPGTSPEARRQEAVLTSGALQDAIFNSANFSSIATDAKGVLQILNAGAERRRKSA